MAKKEMKFYLRKSAFGLASVSAALLVSSAVVAADTADSATPAVTATVKDSSADKEAVALKAETELATAKADLAAAEAAITAANAEYETAQADLATADATIASLEQKMAELESKIQEKQKELEDIIRKQGPAHAAIGGRNGDADAEQLDELAGEVSRAKAALKVELQKVKEELEVAKRAYAGIEERKQVAAAKLD